MSLPDIVIALDEACTLATDPRRLEMLCGNSRLEILRLRGLLQRVADLTPFSVGYSLDFGWARLDELQTEIRAALNGEPEDPLVWSKRHGVEEF